jgi:hypothetical protein
MKKVVRMLGLCALVALAFTACKKNDTKSVTFKASAPTINNNTRTHVEGSDYNYWLEWNEGDAIKVVNADGDPMDFTLTTITHDNGQEAEFKVVGEEGCNFVEDLVNANAQYAAFYPNAVYTKGATEVALAIPAEQTIAGGFRIANLTYPMAGINRNVDESLSDFFQFDSKAGFLYLDFGVQEFTTVTINKIVLTSAIENDLTGTMVYNLDGSFNHFDGTGSVVVATWPVPIVVNHYQPANASIILPEGALSGDFTVEVYNGDELINTFHATANEANTIVARTYTEMGNVLLN